MIVAEVALLDHLQGVVVVRAVAALVADLEDPPGAVRGADHPLGVLQRVGHHLLAVDGLAGFQRVDRHLGVQVERGGDADALEVLALQHLPVVGVDLARPGRSSSRSSGSGVDVRDRHDLDPGRRASWVRSFDALDARADPADPDRVLVVLRGLRGIRRGRGRVLRGIQGPRDHRGHPQGQRPPPACPASGARAGKRSARRSCCITPHLVALRTSPGRNCTAPAVERAPVSS